MNSSGYQYRDMTVPPNTRRLVVAMTWDEAPASAGASRAVLYDLDLWISYNGDCGDPRGLCGAYASTSGLDNVEYVVVNNPPAGTYRLKVAPYSASTAWLAYGLAAMVIRGDPAPGITGYVTAPATAMLYSTFPVTVSVTTPSYVASGVRMEVASHSPWAEPSFVRTTQYDGIGTKIEAVLGLTLGNVFPSISRSATFDFVAKATGLQTVVIRASSENASELLLSAVVNVVTDPTSSPDLVETALTANPPAPIVAPGSTFSATDTVQNAGTREAAPSTTRYYLSLDAMKSSGDTLLTGTHQVPGLNPGGSHTLTVTVTVPPNTAPASYFILACADDLNAVAIESNEGNNCIASPGAGLARRDRHGSPARPGGDRRHDEPTRTDQGARVDVLRERHRPQSRAGRVRAVDHALLSLARPRQGGRRHPADRQPGRTRPVGRRRPFRDRDADRAPDHDARRLLPPDVRRRRPESGGERRGQQLPRLARRGR